MNNHLMILLDISTGASFNNIFNNLSTVLMLGGLLVAIIGITRIYLKWNAGGADGIDKEILQWSGGVLFLMLAAITAKLIFGF